MAAFGGGGAGGTVRGQGGLELGFLCDVDRQLRCGGGARCCGLLGLRVFGGAFASVVHCS